jgi:hypothetical protein
MAKIERYNGDLRAFASESISTERTIFGSTDQGDTLDENITADFLRGWGIVGVNENPTKQDFNGFAYTVTQLIAYLHQQGIPEWNTYQEYYEGSRAKGSDGAIYKSLSGTSGSPNMGNDPTADTVNWWNESENFFKDLTTKTIYKMAVDNGVSVLIEQ